MLFTSKNEPKLCGFDYLESLVDHQLQSSVEYEAPEKEKTSKSNIWSLGVLLYEMIHGVVPFRNGPSTKILGRLFEKSLKFPKRIGEDLKDLLKLMLNRNPEMRPNLEQIMEHKWISKTNKVTAKPIQPLGEEDFELIIDDIEVKDKPADKQSNEDIYTIHRFLAEDDDIAEDEYKIFTPEIEIPLDVLYGYNETRNTLLPEKIDLNEGNIISTTRVMVEGRRSLLDKPEPSNSILSFFL